VKQQAFIEAYRNGFEDCI